MQPLVWRGAAQRPLESGASMAPRKLPAKQGAPKKLAKKAPAKKAPAFFCFRKADINMLKCSKFSAIDMLVV